MVEDHTGLNNERFGESAYLEQCVLALRERERMMRYELERLDEGFLFCLFDTPDRVQHMFWRFGEPDHPANHSEPSPELARVIKDHYRACDEMVSRALECADSQTLLIVLSDHGMNSFRRGVHLNNWLYHNGLLELRHGMRPGSEVGDLFRNVDWERTKAYAVGLGGIYLNLKGREASGVVEAGESEKLKREIAGGLTGLADVAKSKQAIRGVVTREEIYRGPFAHESPDLLVNFAEGYRVSWETALGGVPESLFEDNEKKWGGDHIIDPSLVPGVLFMNRPFDGARASLVDMAPTILSALGVPKGEAMEGESLLV